MINLYSVSSDVMDILGYVLLGLITVGFVLCWIAMAISTIKAFQKKDKCKKEEKVNSNSLQNAIKEKTNAMDFKRKSFEIEKARVERIVSKKKEFS